MLAIIVDGNNIRCRDGGRALFPRTKVVLVCWTVGSIIFNKVHDLFPKCCNCAIVIKSIGAMGEMICAR